MPSSSAPSYHPDPSSLASLSSQLVSLNLTTKQLDLLPVFSPPAQSPLSPSQLASDGRAREALLKCIWAMVGARQEMGEALERVDGMGRVREYELERAVGMVEVEKRKSQVAEKEAQGERAKAKAAQAALVTEQERHRHCREELAKARSALQFVKAQSQLDLKRREAEATSTTTRLQKLTADPTQSKFVVLNPGALPSTSTVSALGARSTARRGAAGLGGTSAADASRLEAQVELTAAVQAEVSMLQEALEGCEQDRQRMEYENHGLRELVGEVAEWAGGMLKLRGIGDGSEVHAAEESFSIPAPHLSLPIELLAPPLQKRLSTIDAGVAVLLSSVSAREELVRAEMQDALDEQRHAKVDERVKRMQVERELEAEREKAVQAARLVEEFASGAFKAVAEDEDEDEIVRRRSSGVKGPKAGASAQDRVEEAKRKGAAAKGKAAEQTDAPTARSTAAQAEAARARTVASFLDELDTPAPAPAVKSAKLLASKPPMPVLARPTTGAEPATRAASSGSGSGSGSSRLAAADASDKPRSSSSSRPSRSSDPAARASGASSSRAEEPARRPSSKPSSAAGASSQRPAAAAAPTSHARPSALAGILALSESPEVRQGERVLTSVRTSTVTTAKVSATSGSGAGSRVRTSREKENSEPRDVVRPLRDGERYKVF